MSAFKRNITWICGGLLLTMLAGAPVYADDTELLLVPPPSSTATKPRIMFIIDTSTSMESKEDTAVPYDPNQTYGGDCDSSKIYWMTVAGVTPDCAGGTTQVTDKASFYCDAATQQMEGLGSYAGVMAQYRDGGKDGTGSGPSKWQYLAEGYDSAPVECEEDSGVHGDGRPNFFWPASGSNLADPFTDVEGDATKFNGAPRNQTYTVYDGNWLNWDANPVIVSESRINIVKQVLTTIFSAVRNVYVGVERFNDSEGGTIIQGLVDIDVPANRTAALDAVASLTPEDHTTIAESYYESVLYWLGKPALFAEIDGDNENFTDENILVDPNSDPPNQVYVQPDLSACAKNYAVMLSDGRAGSRDDKTEALTPALPGYQAATGRTFCDDVTNESDGICIDDLAEYMRNTDISPDATGLPGQQYVTTHTVGFAVDTENLANAAAYGGGTYYLADDGPSLAKAFLEIVMTIADRDLSFVAPAVSVNSFNRTQNLNDMYMTVFKPKNRAHWPGNVKKYRLVDGVISDANGNAAVDPATGFFFDSAKSYWTTGAADGSDVQLGGAARALPDPATRNLYTNNSGSDLTAGNNQLTPANAGAFTDADFGLTGSASEPTVDEIIRWARGEDLLDEDEDGSTNDVRYAMGDPLHSRPAAVVYGGTAANPDVVVFSATNDGYLHAIDASNGQELWSFVPKEMLPRFAELYFDTTQKYKGYGIDGSVVSIVKDDNDNGIVDGSDFVYIIFGLRRGGFNYYALDVTSKTSPDLLWAVTYPEMGESWSTPVVTRIDVNTIGTNADDAVVVVGGGYDTVHDTATYPSTAEDAVGNGIHILDLVSGAELWRAGNDGGADLQIAGMTRSIPGQVRVIDLTGDGFADRMYAADLGGQLLRIDIKNGQAPGALATGGVIAQLGAEGDPVQDFDVTRRFFNTPDVSMFTDRLDNSRFISINIGSGYRAHPLDESADDRFFSVRDTDVFNTLTQAEYDGYDIVTDNDLVEVSGSVRTTIPANKRGWKFTLPPNQKVLSDSVTFNDVVSFVAFAPEENGSDPCSPSLGKNFLYRVSVENGDPVVNNLDTLDPADADTERMEELAQGGIAPTPTIFFPSPDDPNCTGEDCHVPPVACVGVECFDPGFDNNPVRTLWTQDGIQ